MDKLSLIKLEANKFVALGKENKQTLLDIEKKEENLSDREDDLIKQLNAEGEIIPLDYVIKTIYLIEVRTKIAPKGLNYMKTIKNYHIWQRNQRKKGSKKFLIFNLNPFKERKKLEEAYEISKKENAEIVYIIMNGIFLDIKYHVVV